MKYWLIHFDDAERGVEVYTDKAAALRAFELYAFNWNCTLFESIQSNHKEPLK